MEQEPASSGKGMIDHYRRNVLAACEFRSVVPAGNKQKRAEIVSDRAEAKDIFICRGDWIGEFLDELAAFPLGSHDDQVDALSAAYGYLADKHEFQPVAPILLLQSNPWHHAGETDWRGMSPPWPD